MKRSTPVREKPLILIVSELSNDLSVNINEIRQYKNQINDDNFKCYFIYIYSLFEGALWQLAKSILYAFPIKIGSNASAKPDTPVYNINLHDCIDLDFDKDKILCSAIDEKLYKISKANLIDFWVDFKKIVGIECEIDENKLRELSKFRNSVVHNNTLKELDDLNRTSLPEHTQYGKSEINSFADELFNILECLKSKIEVQYKKYTHKKLLKEAWEYTVGGYLRFDELIGFGKSSLLGERTVVCPKFKALERAYEDFSSSEKTMLALWMQQYSTTINAKYIKCADISAFVSLDHCSIEKLIFIIRLFKKFPFLMDGQDYGEEL